MPHLAFDISAPASVSPKQLIDAFEDVNVIVLRDAFLRICFDKRAAVVDFPYGRNAYLPQLSADAILDFCFGSGGVAEHDDAWRRRRSVTVQGVVLPNDFVRKCVEKHRACPFTNPLSIHLKSVENIDHQELAEVAAFTDPSIRPAVNPFKITLVSGGMKLRIHAFSLPGAGFGPEVSVQRALEADFDFIFRARAYRGFRPSWMPR